eukprot:1447054-Rhodomonas_salina.1
MSSHSNFGPNGGHTLVIPPSPGEARRSSAPSFALTLPGSPLQLGSWSSQIKPMSPSTYTSHKKSLHPRPDSWGPGTWGRDAGQADGRRSSERRTSVTILREVVKAYMRSGEDLVTGIRQRSRRCSLLESTKVVPNVLPVSVRSSVVIAFVLLVLMVANLWMVGLPSRDKSLRH